MNAYTTKDLLDFAASAVICDEMAALAVTTGRPGDGRAAAFKEAADKCRAEFDRIAKEMHATPEQISAAKSSVERFRQFARQQFAEMASNN